jgi:hypothetical protein
MYLSLGFQTKYRCALLISLSHATCLANLIDFLKGERTPVPIGQEAGRAGEPVWTQRLQQKPFRLCRASNLDRPVVQPVARHYTDWATRLSTSSI